MKRFLSVSGLLTLALLAGGTASAGAQATKIGYVDADRALSGVPALAQAQQAFQTAAAAFEARRDSLARQFQPMQQAFQNLPVTTTAERRQQEQQRLQATEQQFSERLRPLEETARQRRDALQAAVQPYLERIPQLVEQIRREQGYGMIFSSEAGLMAADPALDLTDTLRQRLLAAPPAAGQATAPARPQTTPPTRP